jgi:SAM-dependent methyltransferase
MNDHNQTAVYSAFADIYDRVMRDVDYESWTEYIIGLSTRFKVKANTVLDLACGTGGHSIHLAQRGYKVTGVDQSYSMLEYAREKATDMELDIGFHESPLHSFSSLHLPQDFDLIICLYDSLNYVLEEELITKTFEEAYKHNRPGGLFIFDVTTEYNLIKNFSGFTFSENFDDASYIWENHYSMEEKVCTSKVTIFQHINGHYQKYVEDHIQKVYTRAWLTQELRDAGYNVLGEFRNMSEMPANPKCERIHFVCQRTS